MKASQRCGAFLFSRASYKANIKLIGSSYTGFVL